MAAVGKMARRALRLVFCLLVMLQKRIQTASKTTPVQGFISGSILDCGQRSKAERLVVVTTAVAFAAWVPSRVTDDGDTVQVAPVGRPEQLNTTT